MSTSEKNIELIAKYQAALAVNDHTTARKLAEEIVTTNEGLAKKLSMRFARPQNDDDKEDAFQAARMGILRAARDFDPVKGSFSTHAGNHIRDYVQRWSGKTVAVVRPRSASMPGRVAKEAAKFRMKHGTEPTAADLGITEAQLTEWSCGTHFVEIDDSDDEKPRLELTYDEREAEHATRCLRVEEAWGEALDELSPRNRDIAERVFIRGEQIVTVAASHDLTHGRVIQICKRIEFRLKRAIDPSSCDPADDPDRKHAASEKARYWARRTRLEAMA